MLLSIVSGTYNRIEHLKSMMQSARRQMLRGLEYEFVIVDGGSIDGTLEWLRGQSDVVLIEHGKLRGAIPAFCDGARAAQGDYVVMANDDIEFLDHSLIRAMAHLELSQGCGAVAFRDNRLGPEYKAQHHPARDRNGTPLKEGMPYAQVGMFRRELGNQAGWWGDRDEIMRHARTYGGDDYLSSRIWEMGYTIDVLSECRINDMLPRDDLRAKNYEAGELDSAQYYKRFPDGAQFGSHPVELPIPPARLRILYLPIFEPGNANQYEQKRGLRDALCRLGIVCEYDYVGAWASKGDMQGELCQIARALRPHILITQVQGEGAITPQIMQQLRGENPEMMCINWNGDYWPEVYLSDGMVNLLRWYDLALCVNDDMVGEYNNRLGIPAAYWQVASEQPQDNRKMPSFDVLYLGNARDVARREFGAQLKELPYNVGIFGAGWGRLGDGDTHYDFAASHALMANAAICIGDNQFPNTRGFVSNRFFETLYAGGFLIHQRVKGLDELTGFVEGKHYVAFDTMEELQELIRFYMDDPTERERIRKLGRRYARRFHSFDARVKELFTKIIPEVVSEPASA
jgi:hypothetical protein